MTNIVMQNIQNKLCDHSEGEFAMQYKYRCETVCIICDKVIFFTRGLGVSDARYGFKYHYYKEEFEQILGKKFDGTVGRND